MMKTDLQKLLEIWGLVGITKMTDGTYACQFGLKDDFAICAALTPEDAISGMLKAVKEKILFGIGVSLEDFEYRNGKNNYEKI